ncbi:MAG TPA: DUF3237 family protein [Solirubrobacteraceae bacterium]|nr:DUF3237 family protein [Solirubrobacteraceae bacterium]
MSATGMFPATSETVETGDREARTPGELIYEYTPQITQVVEYGCGADAVLSGRKAPPAEGARFDFYLEGLVSGPKLRGTMRGVDYIYFRADGRADLHVHAEITTEDGKKLALEAGGVAIGQPGSPLFQLREHVSLISNHPELAWVNPIEVWARGVVDVSTGQVRVRGYAG